MEKLGPILWALSTNGGLGHCEDQILAIKCLYPSLQYNSLVVLIPIIPMHIIPILQSAPVSLYSHMGIASQKIMIFLPSESFFEANSSC